MTRAAAPAKLKMKCSEQGFVMDLINAPATYAFAAVNVIISFYAFFVDEDFMDAFAFRVGAVTQGGQYHRIVTSAFLHVDMLHLLFNMVALLTFGPYVEQVLDTDGMIVVYMGSIVAGKIVAIARNRTNPDYSAVGASGAVSGVILSFCLFYPFENLYLLGLPFGVPAILFGVAYMAISAQLMRNAGRVIGHEAHLGGAAGGALLTLLMRPELVTQWF